LTPFQSQEVAADWHRSMHVGGFFSLQGWMAAIVRICLSSLPKPNGWFPPDASIQTVIDVFDHFDCETISE